MIRKAEREFKLARLLRSALYLCDRGVPLTPIRMRPKLHSAFALRQNGPVKSPNPWLPPLLLSASVVALICAAPLSAFAQTPPIPNPLQYGLGLIGAPAAWAAGYSGVGVTIAIGDTGIDTMHPAFAGKIDPRSMNYVLPAPGAVYDRTQITDLGYHGTHVSGIALASGTSDAPGVAYNADVVMLRVLADTRACKAPGANCTPDVIDDPAASSLDYFATLTNVGIYNASYGPSLPRGTANLQQWPSYTIDATEEAAAWNAVSAGKIIVAATGNDRGVNPAAGRNPNGLALDPFIRPANANAGVYDDRGANYDFSNLLGQNGLIIGVTAVDQNKTIAGFANMCGVTASWCVAAPGVNIYSTLPDNMYGSLSGTSMAAPMVSGALADLTQAYPGYNSQDLAHVLFATAENIGGQAADNAIYGYGLIRLDRAIAGPTTLAADYAVNVANRQMTYWSQPFATSGGFSKTGDGYLIIAGRTDAAGDVAVNGGALGVDGTLTLDTEMTVAQGATLAGFGTINGNTIVNGTLNAGQLPNYSDLIANNGGTLPAGIPLTGTSPGTLTFDGNVTLGSTAIMRVNVDGNLQIPGGPRTYDKIIVDGDGHVFTANGTLTPILRGIPGGTNTYSPTIGTSFPFLMAFDGATVTGSFTGLVQPTNALPANARLDTVYSPTGISLNVTPLTFTGLAAAQGLNINQLALANALDRARPAAGLAMFGRTQTIFDALYQQDAGGDAAALNSLSGQGQAAIPSAILDAFAGFSDVIGDRQTMLASGFGAAQAALTPNIALSYANTGTIAEALGAPGGPFASQTPASAAAIADSWTTWGQGYGRQSRVGEANGVPGANASSGGFVVGSDRLVAANLIAGGAAGYTHTATGSAGMSATADTYAGALYATWTPGPFVFDARLAGGPTTGNTTRFISFPGVSTPTGGTVNGWGLLAAGDAGYQFDLIGVTLKPFAGLTGQNFHRNGFTETSDFGLSFPTRTFDRVTGELGVWTTKLFHAGATTYMLQFKAAWTDDFSNPALTTQAALLDQPFGIAAANPGRDAAVVAVNVAAWQTESVALFANYRGEFRDNATSNQGTIGMRVSW